MTTLTAAEASEMFRETPDQFVDVGNGEVAVRSVGTGPDVLLVHGWPVSGATWRTLLPHLAAHVRCHVVDLVGAGQSRFDRGARFGILEHAEAVRRVLDALGLLEPGSVAVVGHDSGGLIARHALADDPRVRGWGLLDTELSTGMGWRFRSFVSARHVPGVEHVLARLLNAPRLRRTPLLLGGAFADADLLDGEFAEFFLQPLREDPERRWAAGELLRAFDLDLVRRLGEVHARMSAPVQLVYGAEDPFFPAEEARAMLPSFAGPAQLHVVRRGGLFAHEEFGAEVAEVLVPTLKG
ncbi:alpha/beta hydrolase [Nocardioidaceae bacterium]|nr:alpha/beta hydrolase [Nocardioidaceae bacterium]